MTDSGLADPGWLFLAIAPDATTAARIHRLAQILRHAHGFDVQPIESDRLHISLFFLGDLPDQMLRNVCEAAAKVRTQPFEVSFDRTASFQGRSGNIPLVLLGDEGLARLRSFRAELGVALVRNGLRRRARTDFVPHVTLLYGGHRVDEHPIVPIRWMVREFVLIRSRRGHAHLHRWSLDGTAQDVRGLAVRSSDAVDSLVGLG